MLQKFTPYIVNMRTSQSILHKAAFIWCASMVTGCSPSSHPANNTSEQNDRTQSIHADAQNSADNDNAHHDYTIDDEAYYQQFSQRPRVNADAFTYIFDKNSPAVQNYAKSFNLSPMQAQYAMTVIMAAPEALSDLSDRLQGRYLSHYIIDSAQPVLVINAENTPAVQFDYVFTDDFAKGLVLDVVIATPKHALFNPNLAQKNALDAQN